MLQHLTSIQFPHFRARLFTGLLSAILVLSAPGAYSQGGYLEWLNQGLELLQARRFDEALVLMDEAIAGHGDPQFHLLRGVALNRLQRPAEALISLRQAQAAGLDLPRLDFELGMAAVHLRAYALAQERLLRYEKLRPGEARNALLLGRAHLGLRQLDEAQHWYQETRTREPALEAHILDGLARVEAARGDLKAAHEHREALESRASGSPLALGLAQDLGPVRSPWSLSASITPGYNDNVLLTPDGPALPTDVSDTESLYLGLTGNVSYRYQLTPTDALIPSYALQAGSHADVHSADYLTQSLGLGFEHIFSQKLEGSVSLSGQDSRVDGNGFSTGLGLNLALTHRTSSALVLSAGYSFANINYDDDPALGAAVRDARHHALSLTSYLQLPRIAGLDSRLQAGVNYAINSSNGSDYDQKTLGLNLGLSVNLPWRLVLDTRVNFTRSDYDNPNSVAASPALAQFAFARDDRRSGFSLRLSRPLGDGLVAFATYERSRNDSNIQSFDYTQNIWNAGLRLRF
jgi:hypothetical protein